MQDFVLTSDGSWRAKIAQKFFLEVIKSENVQNQTLYELYTDDNKSKYSNNPKSIFKSSKKFYESKKPTSKAAMTEILTKISSRRKVSNGKFNLCEAKISLDEIIKSINSQRNESPGNDGLTVQF